MRAISLIVIFWFSISILRAEMFIQTPQAKEFADSVRAALGENDTVNPAIAARIIAAQQQIAAMGGVADKRLIQMVSEWLTLSEQGEMGTIKGMVNPGLALAFISHDPDAGSLLGPLMAWMDRLADGKMHDQGTLPQRVAMFIALWGGETELQHLKSDMDKLLASSNYDAHMTGVGIREALDGQPSVAKKFAHVKFTLSQWCQRQIDRPNSLNGFLARSQGPHVGQNTAHQPKTTAPLTRLAQPAPQLAVAPSSRHFWWLWSGGIAAVLVIIYVTIKKCVCRR